MTYDIPSVWRSGVYIEKQPFELVWIKWPSLGGVSILHSLNPVEGQKH